MVAREQISGLDRRTEKNEETISQIRRAVIDVEKYLAQIRGPVSWMIRFAGLTALGIMGLLGVQLWSLVIARHP